MPPSETSARNKRPGDEAVKAKTGKNWAEWFRVLDAAGALEMDHKEIVAVLRDQFGIGPWWQQMVTVAYEQERGKRELHEKPEGFEISRSKTIEVPITAMFEAWENEGLRRQWLSDPDITIRKATPGKSIRLTWADNRTHVTAHFYNKGEGKTQITVQHGKLASRTEADHYKAYWEDHLNRLKELLKSKALPS